MRITSKGQVTIPMAIRERLGLLPDTEVEFEIDRDAVRMKKASAPRDGTAAARSSSTCAVKARGASPPTRS